MGAACSATARAVIETPLEYVKVIPSIGNKEIQIVNIVYKEIQIINIENKEIQITNRYLTFFVKGKTHVHKTHRCVQFNTEHLFANVLCMVSMASRNIVDVGSWTPLWTVSGDNIDV